MLALTQLFAKSCWHLLELATCGHQLFEHDLFLPDSGSKIFPLPSSPHGAHCVGTAALALSPSWEKTVPFKSSSLRYLHPRQELEIFLWCQREVALPE